jgi:hypothetical protein
MHQEQDRPFTLPKRLSGVERSAAELQILFHEPSREADWRAERNASGAEGISTRRNTLKRLVAKRPDNEKAVRQLGRPSLSRENSSNGAQKRPSELSGEILLGIERQCQGFFGE